MKLHGGEIGKDRVFLWPHRKKCKEKNINRYLRTQNEYVSEQTSSTNERNVFVSWFSCAFEIVKRHYEYRHDTLESCVYGDSRVKLHSLRVKAFLVTIRWEAAFLPLRSSSPLLGCPFPTLAKQIDRLRRIRGVNHHEPLENLLGPCGLCFACIRCGEKAPSSSGRKDVHSP